MRPLDHETHSAADAAGFESYNAESDWDRQLAADEARLGGFPQPELSVGPSNRPRLPEWDDLW